MSRRVAPPQTRFPLEVVGSSKFGRYPKISAEQTYNMFISDGWLVPTPGHLKILSIDPRQEGRGIFASARGNILIAVIGNNVWRIDPEIYQIGRTIPVSEAEKEQFASIVGTIPTFTGDVFIDENEAEQIAICDLKNIYIYNYDARTFDVVIFPAEQEFTPGYIAFQDGYFIAPNLEKSEWRLSASNNGLSWPVGAANTGEFQSKPDKTKACVRVPGKGNQLFVMGSTVTESWNDIGYRLFPYYRTNSFNIDYGCLNQATIATSDKFVIWLAANEKSGPVIMFSSGGPPQQISTDGINFALSQLENPEDAYGFLYKSDGHLFYHLTFTRDNVTYLYDFTTNKFFFLSQEDTTNHIAKKVAFFSRDYYFISLVDGNLYRLSADIDTYDGNTIPRMRVTNTIRATDDKPFIGQKLGFTLEQGESGTVERVDTSLSYNGGVTFGNIVGQELNALGHRQNRFTHWDLGRANELTVQFRFWGKGRFVCNNGYVDVYQ